MTSLTEIAKKQKRPSKTKKVKTKTRKADTGSSTNVPYVAIAKAYNDGQSMAQISDGLKLTKKDSKVPYSVVNNALWRLGKPEGVTVDGKTVKIVRGKRTAAKKAA